MKYKDLKDPEQIKAFVQEFGDRVYQNARKRGDRDPATEESAKAILKRMLEKRMIIED